MSSSVYGSEAAIASSAGARARVSWSAIFAGVVIVIGIQIMLSVLGAGVGLGFVNTHDPAAPTASSVGAGAGIWWLLTTVVALVVGSFAAARLAGVPTRFDGILHGVVIWGLAVILTLFLVTSAIGGIVGGAFSVIGSTVSAAGSAVGSAASAAGEGAKSVLPRVEQSTGINPDVIQQQAESLLQGPTPQDAGSMSRPDAVKAVAQQLPALASGGDGANAAKQRITDIVAAQAKISPQEAQGRVNDAMTKFQQTKDQATEKAKQAADAAASGASHASFLAFAGLLVGAVAGCVGGALASPRRFALTEGRLR